MKRYLYLIILLFTLTMPTLAQVGVEKNNQSFRFVYLVHDPKTPKSTLIKELRDAERKARQSNQICFIHMGSFLAQINTENDNREYFDKLLEELNSKLSHDVNIQADITSILDILNEYQIVDENGELLYRSVVLDFYLTSRFCENGYAERFIVPLYIALDVPNMPNKFEFNVFVHADSDDSYDFTGEKTFGENNYNSINENILIMDY